MKDTEKTLFNIKASLEEKKKTKLITRVITYSEGPKNSFSFEWNV